MPAIKADVGANGEVCLRWVTPCPRMTKPWSRLSWAPFDSKMKTLVMSLPFEVPGAMLIP